METIYLSLRAKVVMGTFLMKSPVTDYTYFVGCDSSESLQLQGCLSANNIYFEGCDSCESLQLQGCLSANNVYFADCDSSESLHL